MNTSLQKAVANALSFAHLAGLGRAKSSTKAEDEDDKKDRDREDGDAKGSKASADDEKDDDERKQREGESDDDYAKRMDKLDEEEKDDKASRASTDDEKDKDKGDEKAKGASAEDDDDEEMRGNSASAKARRREQARCAAIFASPAAGRNPVLAANLAFKSRMGRMEALAILESTPAGAIGGVNADRSARNPRLGNGGSDGMTTTQAVAKSWDSAFAKVTPQRRN